MPDRARRSLARMPIQMRTMPSALLRPAGHRAGKPMHIRGGRGDLRTKAGSSDSMSSCCASNAPNTPANTSPEPAVAIQAGARPDRMIRVFPSPSAPTTMVTAPLSSTVAPVSSCARNAARNGRASTHCLETTSAISASNRFSNAANSPACGVITTCGTTWHGSKSNAPASTTMGGMPSARSFREPSPSSNA